MADVFVHHYIIPKWIYIWSFNQWPDAADFDVCTFSVNKLVPKVCWGGGGGESRTSTCRPDQNIGLKGSLLTFSLLSCPVVTCSENACHQAVTCSQNTSVACQQLVSELLNLLNLLRTKPHMAPKSCRWQKKISFHLALKSLCLCSIFTAFSIFFWLEKMAHTL